MALASHGSFAPITQSASRRSWPAARPAQRRAADVARAPRGPAWHGLLSGPGAGRQGSRGPQPAATAPADGGATSNRLALIIQCVRSVPL